MFRGRAIHGLLAAFAIAQVCFSSEPARFWLSTSNISPTIPLAPTIAGVHGSRRYLHIWAQPATVGNGQYHPIANPFKVLKNFSLNLVASRDPVNDPNPPIIDLLDGTFTVHNQVLADSMRRFEFVNDSRSEPALVSSASAAAVAAGAHDQLTRIQGFSIESTGIQGIGPTCQPNDPLCEVSGASGPAWLVASVAYQVMASTGGGELFLQVGNNGMSHVGEASSAMNVVFGLNPTNPQPIYNTGNNLEREVTFQNDAADAVIQALPASAVQNLVWSGDNGHWTDLRWSLPGRIPSFSENALLGADLGPSVVTVNGNQQANQTTVEGGRLHLAAGASLASPVSVVSGGEISGTGWVNSDLSLSGALVLNATEPLLVMGAAQIASATLAIGDGYTQAADTLSPPLTVLRAIGGIQGTFTSQPGESLGRGIVLESIDYTDSSVVVRLRSSLAGDYTGDGLVNDADFNSWKVNFGSAAVSRADGNGDRVVNAADYSVWRDNLNQGLGLDAVVRRMPNTQVPEPASIALSFAVALPFVIRSGRKLHLQ